MLGLWGFQGDPGGLGVSVERLPTVPARGFAAFLISVRTDLAWHKVESWSNTIWTRREDFPIGLVLGESQRLRNEVLRSAGRWRPIILREDFKGEFPPRSAVERLRQATISVRIAAAWASTYEAESAAHDLLEVLAVLAAEGRGVAAASRALALSRSSLERELRSLGLPPPGFLLRQGRVFAYDLRVNRGMTRSVARELGGWMTDDAVTKALGRMGSDRLPVDS